MLQTVYYDPFRIFEQRGRRHRLHASANEGFRPDVDIIESSDEYRLLFDLPGIDPQSIDVTEENSLLTIQAEKTAVQLEEGQTLSRSERRSGTFKRQFTLPEDADAGDIHAESRNGVLTLVISRRQPQESLRKIEVSE
jgi:HSP20 family protein